jgi:hypothetical protein
MKKKITIDATYCDACGLRDYVDPCLGGCGVEHCWRCQETQGVKYNHGVYFSGGGDGYYCRPCDMALSENGTNPLHQAYQAIRALRDESAKFYADHEARTKVAEKNLMTQRTTAGVA